MFVVVLVMVGQGLDEEIVQEGPFDVLGLLVHCRPILLRDLDREDRVQRLLLLFVEVAVGTYEFNNWNKNII